MRKARKSNAEGAAGSQRSQDKKLSAWLTYSLGVLCAFSASTVLSLWKLTLVATLAIGIAGCGTKTELLKPDGKPTPRGERDPSQPPNPISR